LFEWRWPEGRLLERNLRLVNIFGRAVSAARGEMPAHQLHAITVATFSAVILRRVFPGGANEDATSEERAILTDPLPSGYHLIACAQGFAMILHVLINKVFGIPWAEDEKTATPFILNKKASRPV
jgi:hypothetical protein